MELEKYDTTEDIGVGDLVSFKYIIDPDTKKLINTNKVTKSIYHRMFKNPVIGVCSFVAGNNLTILNEGIIDVNVTGMIAIDDKLTTSKIAGKAEAIDYPIYDEILYREVSIGKVVGIYRYYNKAKVLLELDQ